MAKAKPIPEGFHSLTPHLVVKGASEAIDFYKKAFGAVEIRRSPMPDGKKFEVSLSDRLAGKVTKVIDIPANAVPDASKLIVKVYPGVFSQILEGVEGLIRLPGG